MHVPGTLFALFLSIISFLALAAAAAPVDAASAALPPLRPPAAPLVTCDPYFSIWSPGDRLTDVETTHWTGKPHPLHSLVRIDGKAFRLMGAEPKEIPALPQVGLEVLPTRTTYRFANGAVQVSLTFLTPLLPSDLDVLSRPVTYLTWEARPVDGQPHEVAVYFDASPLLAVNTPDQEVVWSRVRAGTRFALRVGSKEQPVLAKRGDDLRIDWGYLYLMPGSASAARMAIAPARQAVDAFVSGSEMPVDEDPSEPKPAREAPVLACRLSLGTVKARPAEQTLLLAYDDEYSIEYFRHRLRPYWRRKGADADDLLRVAARDYAKLKERAAAFDDEVMADMTRVGGERYARICALAYRQALAANKLAADSRGRPIFLSKENFSNGCIGTVDIVYPTAPMLLLFSPALLKASMVPVLDYASSDRWPWPFAPHDLGTYPKANGQVYGGGERTEENQMPVEECGNMLILLAAVARAEGTPELAARYWPVVTQWAEYLRSKGLDPENQLCTDDFAGHLAHNVNLSAKAIVGLGSYAYLCDLRGDGEQAEEYRKIAREFAATWAERALDGDHYRLAFDRPGTWSQKYNLVWDRILDLGLFPREVARREMAHYRRIQNRYGVPLDNRRPYTKLDWVLWTATLTEYRPDFEALVAPVYDWLNETPDRVPMTDWYGTVDGRKQGFQARSVVGGVFLRALYDDALWAKWAGRSPRIGAEEWAPLPKPPQLKPIVPSSQAQPTEWRYTLSRPGGDWYDPGYDDAGWQSGPGGFGRRGTPGAVVRTEWTTPDIWLRRVIEVPAIRLRNPHLWLHHDEDVEVYINGVLAVRASGYVTEYQELPITEAARAALKPGKNVLAIHCKQTTGGQYVDAGIVDVLKES